MSAAARATTGVALLAVLAGCGSSAGAGGGSKPPGVTVQAGGDAIPVDPTQYCLDGKGQRYKTTPPILEVTPDTTVVLRVPDAVAKAGWSVQVFDQKLEEEIGEVDVPAGAADYEGISTSDVVPATFYLVIVQKSAPEACNGLSGAWPVGFIRTDGTMTTAPATTTPAG